MTNRVKHISIVIALVVVAGTAFYFARRQPTNNNSGQQIPSGVSQGGAKDSNVSQGSTVSPGSQGSKDSKVSMPTQAMNPSLNPRGEAASTTSQTGTSGSPSTQGENPAAPAPGVNVPAGAPTAADGSKPADLKVADASANGCFEMSFKHRKLPTHSDAESCHRHKNRIKLAHALKDLKGICVRVDGDAVAFEKIKGSDNEIILAGVAGPDSLIKVNYCRGNAKCSAECKIKPRKDAFLEAVGGVNDEKDNGQIAEWDAEGASDADKKAVREVASEIQALDSDLKAEKDEDNVEFSGWDGGAESASSSCEIQKQAQKESPRG